MNREEFLSLLAEKIAVLPTDEKNKVYEYYNEIILEKKESGEEEADIIAAFGDINDIATNLLSEFPDAAKQPEAAVQQAAPPPTVWNVQPPLLYPPPPKKRLSTAMVWVLALTSPIWIILLLAACIVLFSVIIALISLLISLWAAAVTLVLSGLFYLAVSFTLFPQGTVAFFNLGLALFCTGLGCLLSAGMVQLTQLSFRFLKWLFQKISGLFRKKQEMPAEGGAFS